MSERIITDRHWLVIVNPESGKSKSVHQSDDVSQKLEASGVPFYLKVSEFPGHAIEIAKKYARRGCLNFLVIGGDGTINEVVNGIFSANIDDTSIVKLAILPSGTGNDWGRFWNIKKNDRQAMKCFLQGHTKLIDIGKVGYSLEKQDEERFFINSVGFGLDAAVVDFTHRYKKHLGNFSLPYTLGLLRCLMKTKIKDVSIDIDGEEKMNLPLLTMNIANGPYTGGGIKQNPLALPYDAIFHMMLVGKLTFRDIIVLLPKLFNGKLTAHKKIHTYKAKEIVISSEEELMVETDGVLLDRATEYKVALIPQAIQMIVPKKEV